jgi:hypothetical protein
MYRLGFSANFIAGFWDAMTDWIPLEASLWFLGSPVASFIVLGTIAVAIVGFSAFSAVTNYAHSRERMKRSVVSSIWALACAYALILAANSPSIISDATTYIGLIGGEFARVMLPSSALMVILLVWIGVEAFAGSPKVLGAVLIPLTISAGVSAHIRAYDTAMNSYTEFAIIRDAVGRQAQIEGPIKELLVIRPPEGHSYLGPPPFNDEFDFVSSLVAGNTSLMYDQALHLEPQSPAVAALDQQGQLLLDPAYTSAIPCKKSVYYLSEEAVIADLAAPMYLVQNSGSCVGTIARYFVTPVSDPRHIPSKAFAGTGTPDDFWEATPYPVTLSIFYPSTERATAYSLGTNAGFDSMVTGWRLEASNDNVGWVTLDQQSGIRTWPPNGARLTFPIANPGSYRAYRFVFTQGSDRKMRIYHIAIELARSGNIRGQVPLSP